MMNATRCDARRGLAPKCDRMWLRRVLAAGAMGLLTATAAAGMPRLVTGDGSPDGAFRVMQTYALGTVWLLLCVTTLWVAGALSISDGDAAGRS